MLMRHPREEEVITRMEKNMPAQQEETLGLDRSIGNSQGRFGHRKIQSMPNLGVR